MKTFSIHTSVWHDSSTKGFRHNIKHKRHDCWRADIRIKQKINNVWVQISRIRKRFKCPEQAKSFAEQWKQTETPAFLQHQINRQALREELSNLEQRKIQKNGMLEVIEYRISQIKELLK
ncbi:TPA: hypothetical protein PWY77_002367 [Mannheimia haemolytica]|uniref:hypothetical protein n=2 Tax=root TaxID=1 RepID=UPI0001BCF683|nr:hypothetical protein [Mannheimia haemolytica]YP_009193599.1 hypothetical protein AU484_gp48 [Mannheimia phage vB_MhS_587AP2]AJA73023.1 hypothetical protein 587AP2_48 [Mannheimia phage vB_MhS_587AP2]EEY10684.1 hypothetical protein COI_0671 [Mannheimia haemolytica serotype A2 str. OVINE]KYL20464.1 hypothetical protein AC574_12260 [Mannheimia haemolytica]MDW0575945.1 hypothetical protein [Mannheimia haemolytica]MDW0626098.1 hypothetical protein [Mannheimia haemolytica]